MEHTFKEDTSERRWWLTAGVFLAALPMFLLPIVWHDRLVTVGLILMVVYMLRRASLALLRTRTEYAPGSGIITLASVLLALVLLLGSTWLGYIAWLFFHTPQ